MYPKVVVGLYQCSIESNWSLKKFKKHFDPLQFSSNEISDIQIWGQILAAKAVQPTEFLLRYKRACFKTYYGLVFVLLQRLPWQYYLQWKLLLNLHQKITRAAGRLVLTNTTILSNYTCI